VWENEGGELRPPKPQAAIPGHIEKVSVGCQHRQIVTDAKLRQQGIDRPDLYAASAAFITQLRGGNMVAPLGNQERQLSKSLYDSFYIPGSEKAL
jgi:hypothetical protein